MYHFDIAVYPKIRADKVIVVESLFQLVIIEIFFFSAKKVFT